MQKTKLVFILRKNICHYLTPYNARIRLDCKPMFLRHYLTQYIARIKYQSRPVILRDYLTPSIANVNGWPMGNFLEMCQKPLNVRALHSVVKAVVKQDGWPMGNFLEMYQHRTGNSQVTSYA